LLYLLDKKTAYNLKASGEVLMQFYMVMCLTWFRKLIKLGIFDLDI